VKLLCLYGPIIPTPAAQRRSLLRAARSITQKFGLSTWVGSSPAWDRFEIGKRIISLYVQVLETSPPTSEDRPFPVFSQSIADVLYSSYDLHDQPLVSSISSGGQVLRMLYASRRHGDVRRLIFFFKLPSSLSLILNYKLKSNMASKLCLLEQALCARITGEHLLKIQIIQSSILSTFWLVMLEIGMWALWFRFEAMRVLYPLVPHCRTLNLPLQLSLTPL